MVFLNRRKMLDFVRFQLNPLAQNRMYEMTARMST